MALFSILFILLLNVISSSSHTVYFEGQAPKVVQQANTNYEIKKSNPGIVITNFGDDTIQLNNGDDSDGISVGIIQKVYTRISSNPPSMANCKIYSLPDNQLRTDLHHQLEFGVPFGSFFNSNTSISLSCYKANATDFMLVVQSKNNANFLGYSIYASGIPPTQFGMDKEIVFTTISLEPAVPYIRSLTFLTGSYFEVGDSTPQKPPSWNVTAAFVNSVIPTNNYLFTTYFLKAKVTMEIVSHLNVCSGKRTITQADMDQNGVFKFPYVDLNGGYDCSFEIIPPSKEYYTKVQMGGFLTTSFYLDLYYKKEFARTFTIPGNNLLTGTYYFPNGGVLEFDSGNDGYATITFIITFIKLPIAPAINKEFTDSGQGNLTTLAGIISLFTAKDAANTSLTVLSVNQNPYSLEVKTSLDYCFLTIRYDSGDIERYSLREFTVFRTPTLFKKAYFQCVEPPQHQGDVIIVVGNSSDWLTVCQIAASYADCLNEITFPENPNCNGFNYLIQTKGHIQYNTTITRIDSEPETDVLVFRGIFSGNYIGSISRRTLPFTSDDDCVSYLGVSTSNITLHWKTATVSTTTQPMTDINTTPSLEFTTKPAISCLSMFFVLLLSFLV